MGNFLLENRLDLEKFHYIRKADASTDYWFSFNQGKLERYLNNYGENFCLVLVGSDNNEDSYVMPYREVKSIFSVENLVPKNRWVGTVRNDILRIHGSGEGISVSRYYNALNLLEDENFSLSVKESKANYSPEHQITQDELRRRIQHFNTQYINTVPHRKNVISEQIARPGIITDHLKKLREYTCQFCHTLGFMKRNGNPCIEAHHIRELHELIPGSYCSDNIVIVCPTCHKKLHYANVEYRKVSETNITVIINGEEFTFERNVVT